MKEIKKEASEKTRSEFDISFLFQFTGHFTTIRNEIGNQMETKWTEHDRFISPSKKV